MKLISFSLWGGAPKYCVGAIKNADLARWLFPDWRCRFYCDAAVPANCLAELASRDNVQLVRSPVAGAWECLTKRFLPMSEDGVEVMISRDADSRLSRREQAAVALWLESGKAAHVMRDHPFHGGFPMMGGMFGIRSKVINDIATRLEQFKIPPAYNFDQEFLAQQIWPLVKDDCVVHDEFFEKKPFPAQRKNLEFVGQVFDERDQPVESHAEVLKQVLAMQFQQGM